MEEKLAGLRLDASSRSSDTVSEERQSRSTKDSTSSPSTANLALGSLNAARGKSAIRTDVQAPAARTSSATQPSTEASSNDMDPEVLKRIAAFAGRSQRPAVASPFTSGQAVGGLSGRRVGAPGLKLGGVAGNAPTGLGARRGVPKLGMPAAPDASHLQAADPTTQNGFQKYANVVDAATGSLKFKGAVLSSEGVNFGNGREYKVRLQDLDKLDELGRGNYGTVWRVKHKTTGAEMAMKEIRLALDEAVFSQIIMELDVLHKAACPEIVDFYGAFFVEGCVYILMEFMDAGSLEKIYTTNVSEGVLAKITLSAVRALHTLKDRHNIIHRDVKPTNILVNSKGQVKLCDFGVSGNLVASIAKTNIGCQSYMAPERIRSENAASGPSTYTVHSDIWSLGLSILELAKGGYPYPPETYNNIFAQLQAICDGDPPDLPAEHYSADARDFVRQCLNKDPKSRPPYATLLMHPWLRYWSTEHVDMPGWIKEALEMTRQTKNQTASAPRPAMHSINTQLVRDAVR